MPRCKNPNCGEKFEAKYFNQKSCMQKDECITWHVEYAKQQELKKQLQAHAKKKKQLDPILKPKKYKGYLNDECQKLARMIDAKFGNNTCIDCGKPFGNQIDGGHFKSKGSNQSISWNLHNIHSQRSDCNQNGLGGGKERGYYNGLISRYGKEYAEMVDIGLQKEYKYLGLKETEIAEKLKAVRAIIRNFDTYNFNNAIHAREMCNKLIGIYK